MYVQHFLLLIIWWLRMQVKLETMAYWQISSYLSISLSFRISPAFLAFLKFHRKIWHRKKTIPNWSGFFSIVEAQLQQDIRNVIYLLSITEFGSVLPWTFEAILFILRTTLPDTRVYYGEWTVASYDII